MSALDDAPLVPCETRAEWRAWLELNHAASRGAWLVTWRKGSGRPTLDYEAAIEEALCFGWVDSTGGRVDDLRGKLYFAPRRPRSGWARTNKARVERLTAAGLMTPAGLAAVERAKANGAWTMLEDVENLVVPDDLAAALDAEPLAAANWAAFAPSTRRGSSSGSARQGGPRPGRPASSGPWNLPSATSELRRGGRPRRPDARGYFTTVPSAARTYHFPPTPWPLVSPGAVSPAKE